MSAADGNGNGTGRRPDGEGGTAGRRGRDPGRDPERDVTGFGPHDEAEGFGQRRGGRGFEDDLIRDRDIDFGDDWDEPVWDTPGPSGDDGRDGSGDGRRQWNPRDVNAFTDVVGRLAESVAALAGDSMPPEARRRLERILLDLLLVTRDAVDWAIERLEERDKIEIEIEEIPVE